MLSSEYRTATSQSNVAAWRVWSQSSPVKFDQNGLPREPGKPPSQPVKPNSRPEVPQALGFLRTIGRRQPARLARRALGHGGDGECASPIFSDRLRFTGGTG